MTSRRLLVWFIAGATLANSTTLRGQSLAAPVGVDESKAVATLATDSIRVQLPLIAPAGVGVRAVAWVISPAGVKSDEISAGLAEHARIANFTLPWPRDEKDRPATEIGWYRVGYRVETADAKPVNGALSVGAIASNLLTLRLALQEKLVAGKPLSVRVFAVNPVTQKPFRGVRIEGTLKYDGEPDEDAKPFNREVIRQATTSGAGEAMLVYPVQGEPGDTATLTVTGVMADASGARTTARMDADVEISDRTTVRVETDKPLHKPGEVVHLRALIFDDAGRAAAKTDVTLTIKDPEGKTLLEESLTTDRFGIAAYDWKTRAQQAPGEYEAHFALDRSADYTGSTDTTISIRRYELPEFSVAATMDRGFYLDGQAAVVHLHAGYLFGKPVSAGTVRLVRAEDGWYGSRKKKAVPETEQKATLEVNGDAELTLKISDDFSEFKGNDWERYRDIQYRAFVTDTSSGRTEPRNFTVRLTRDPVHIYLYRLGGNDREGDFIVSTAYADGRPAICRVELNSMAADSNPLHLASVSTNRYGLARVHLRYGTGLSDEEQPRGLKLRIAAHDAEGRTSIFDDTIYENRSKSVWFTVAESLLKPGEAIEATLHGEAGSILEVDAYSAQGLLAHQRVRMGHTAEQIRFLATEGFHGLVTLIAYTMNSDSGRFSYGSHGASAYKAVLYPEDRELKLKLSGVRNSYAPGAAVLAGLDVRDAAGVAVAGALGVSVIDTAVEQRAETEEDANRWSRGGWWQYGSDGVSVPLNQVDMSGEGPVPEDLQLAAEAALVSVGSREVKLEFDDYDEARNEYTALIGHDLKPLGAAVLAARTARLPATLESLLEIARRVGMDEALLVDPWNTPYKVQTEVEWNTESLRVVSAGPDKRFGTDDDFTVAVTQRNIFALPGEQLTRLLRDAVDAGQPLPGTLDSLKHLAQAGGEDMDAVLDPDGQPYQYRINVGRRYYSVQVFRHDIAADADGNLVGMSVWSSPSIDYFARTELRIEAALAQWTNAGQPFPVTEAEARQALIAGGVDPDALRDPLGQSLGVRTTEVFALTSSQTVKAGEILQAGSKQVTRQLHAIQLVRPRAQDGDATAPDVVAQFLSAVTDQSGRDLKPQASDGRMFKGNTGAIGGTVTDKTGAYISNATITLKRASGEDVTTGKTNPDGTYLISDLDGGLYTVEVSAPGFEGYLLTEVRVSASSLTTVDVTLSVGAANETVTVSADAATLNTTSASLGTTIGMAGTSRTVGGKGGQATITEQTFTPRLRHVFEETAFWMPSLATDASGRASLRFNLPDSLTTWKLHALASTVDGRVGVLEQKFRTFQPLFVDLDLPQVLTVGDEIQLPVNLRNYTGHSVTLPVTAKPADWLTLLTPSTVRASVSSDASEPVVFGLRADHTADAGAFRVTAANAREGDAVERTVRVHPDGEPRAVTAASLLTSRSSTLSLDLPADAIPGSLHAELLLYPNLGAHVLHAMKAVLERPYGCGEQTISSTYPSLLYLELLKAGRREGTALDSSSGDAARTYLQLGYDRLLGYFDSSGGLTYWGGNDHAPDPALTAYGIEFLSEAGRYVAVDRSYITRAVDWLLAQQQAEGGWKPHYGDSNAELNLYIAEVLEQSLSDDALAGEPAHRERMTRAVARATAWAGTSVAAVHAPYANALRLRLAIQTGDAAAAARLRAGLAATAVHGSGGAHWSPQSYSPFYGWGRAGELETTALVLAALRQDSGARSAAETTLANDALFFLLGSEDRFGVWYSGQATVRVLQALLPAAVEQMKASATGQEFRLSINGVSLTGDDAQALRVDPKLSDAPRSLDLTRWLKPGHNELAFASTNDASLASAEATASYYIPWQGVAAPSKTQTGSDAGLDFSYSCAADGARTGSPVECNVAARRFGSQSYGMLLAEVGLPPGADVDRASLARLLDDGTISRYEMQPDRIVFYLWSWRAEGSRFSFRFTPRYAIRAKAAPATLSDYYNPDLKVVLPPQTFLVSNQTSH